MAAETPSSSPPSSPPPPPPPLPHSHNHQQQQYWCHHCEKRVYTETLPGQPDVICSDCKFGFVESIPASIFSPSSPPDFPGGIDEPTLGSQFLHVLRLLSQVARDDHPAPPPPPPPPRASSSPSDDFFRIEIDSWNNNRNNNNDDTNNNEVDNDDEDEERYDDDEEDVRSVEIVGESVDGDADERGDEDEDENENERRRLDVLRLRLRDFAARARSDGRNRILDWAEILMGLEDNSIEFRFEVPAGADRYVGDPGDYVEASEYDALLQRLADAEGRRGAPPTAKAAIEALKVVEIKEDSRVGYEEGIYVCAICKDGVSVGDVVKEMPCGHGYHGDCIVPWLSARNSCPVCRFELPTDDPEYEEDKMKRSSGGSGTAGNDGSSAVGSSSVASV